jgi:Icc-related predicted phosphoesterase
MKMIVRSITLCLVFCAACAVAQTVQSSQSSIEAQIIAKEREGLEALKVGNLELFANLTADDAVFVDSQGPATKEQVMKNVQYFRLTDYTMQSVKFVSISPTSSLISYKAPEKGTSYGREFTAVVYVSSVWSLRGGRWVCQFSQETLAPKAQQ